MWVSRGDCTHPGGLEEQLVKGAAVKTGFGDEESCSGEQQSGDCSSLGLHYRQWPVFEPGNRA